MSFMRHEEYAAAGAKYLDNLRPGWYEKINLGNLDIASGTFCILGQLYGAYEDGIEHMTTISAFDAHLFGFQHAPNSGYKELTQAWIREIMMRRNPPVVEIMDKTLQEEAAEFAGEKDLVPA